MPAILVVNDDGIDSEGISELARTLQAPRDVTVVAPDGGLRRRPSQAIHRSIRSTPAVRAQAMPGEGGLRRYACSGTPPIACCWASNGTLRRPPRISWWRRDSTAARTWPTDVNYSGTVAAAVESTIVGIPAIAVSLVSSWPKTRPSRPLLGGRGDRRAGDLAADVLRDRAAGTYWNVNVPEPRRIARHAFHATRPQNSTPNASRASKATHKTRKFRIWVWDMSHLGGGDDHRLPSPSSRLRQHYPP